MTILEGEPREDRRRRTEAAILHAAQEQFGEQGFERTTIRSVAAQAGIDPALVMQYFGSKEQLFAASASWPVEHDRLGAASRADLPGTALDVLFGGFEDPERREAALALLRNCLTHPGAAEVMRDDVMCESQSMISATIGGEDGELRAATLAACMIGVTIARYLLEVPAMAGASREDLERVLRPALRELVEPGQPPGSAQEQAQAQRGE